ncbi:hypothetical protein M427DRAFT_105993, partial [Gonapodya prolifera JEL478]
HLVEEFWELLKWDVQRLTQGKLTTFCHAIMGAGSPLDNVFGFVDGTVKEITWPELNQRLYYNGHKWMHGLKYTSIIFPDGIMCLTGPFVGRYHNVSIWRMSGMEDILQKKAFDTNNRRIYVYGDPAYLSALGVIPAYRGYLTQAVQEFNTAMVKIRIAVEWGFAKVCSQWAHLDFAPNLKTGLSPVGLYYIVAVLFSNCHTCIYGHQVLEKFMLDPPSLEEYLYVPADAV